jgi:NAD(P)-dependent dehydrogenase (short-subunit alcohol dehydrogenase family)
MQKQLAKGRSSSAGVAHMPAVQRLTARKKADGSGVGEPSHVVCKLADGAIQATLSATMKTFENKTVVITGVTSGIGKATALAFSEQGANVVVSGRRISEGENVVREITSAGGNALFVRTDVSREDDITALIEKTVATFGALHIAFNNAGTEQFGPLTTEQTVEHYRRVCEINILGVLLSMKHEIPAMLRSGGGAIVNTSSVAGHVGFPGASVYVASKFAVIGLTKTAALEFAKQGVRVNSVSPGPVQTEMFDRTFGKGQTDMKKAIEAQSPAGRVGTPEEIASAVLWLSSPGAAFTTGQDIIVDGGFSAQ